MTVQHVDDTAHIIFIKAIEAHEDDIIKDMLQAGKVDIGWRQPVSSDFDRGHDYLTSAITWGSLKIVELLLLAGAPINRHTRGFRQFTPLHWSVFANDANKTKLLLRMGANVYATDEFCQTPLHLARWSPFYSSIAVLLQVATNTQPLISLCLDFICRRLSLFGNEHLACLPDDCIERLRKHHACIYKDVPLRLFTLHRKE